MLRNVIPAALLIVASCALPAAAQQAQPQVQQPADQGQQPAAKPKPKAKPKDAKKPAAAPATSAENKARMLEKFKEWTVFVHDGTDGRVCFAAAVPSDVQPKAAKRTAVVFYLTTWQKDGVRNEVSVKQGYAMKANATATVTIGAQNYGLAADDDKAFMKDAADERKLISAMSKGGAMIVKATSAKGTATTDQYSLDGAGEAIKKVQEACP